MGTDEGQPRNVGLNPDRLVGDAYPTISTKTKMPEDRSSGID
jgi:hypothetical protein